MIVECAYHIFSCLLLSSLHFQACIRDGLSRCRGYAQTFRRVLERDPNPESSRFRQTSANTSFGEGSAKRRARKGSGWLRKISRSVYFFFESFVVFCRVTQSCKLTRRRYLDSYRAWSCSCQAIRCRRYSPTHHRLCSYLSIASSCPQTLCRASFKSP